MNRYMYKIKFRFELGGAEAEGDVQAENKSAAENMIVDDYCKSYNISEDDIESIKLIEI